MGGSKRKAIAAEDSDDEGSAPTQRGKKPRVGDRDRGRGPQRGERSERGERGERGGRGRPGSDRSGRGGNRGMGRRDSGKSDRPSRGPEGKTPAVQAVQEKRGLEKLGAQLGSLIGRKRKMRRGN
jgi:nucleolar protein 4